MNDAIFKLYTKQRAKDKLQKTVLDAIREYDEVNDDRKDVTRVKLLQALGFEPKDFSIFKKSRKNF